MGSDMEVTYGVALKEKPLDEGLDRWEVIELFDKLHGASGIPFEVQAENSVAMGFINRLDAEFMNYDYTKVEELVRRVLNDMQYESPDCRYSVHFKNVGDIDIWLSR